MVRTAGLYDWGNSSPSFTQLTCTTWRQRNKIIKEEEELYKGKEQTRHFDATDSASVNVRLERELYMYHLTILKKSISLVSL